MLLPLDVLSKGVVLNRQRSCQNKTNNHQNLKHPEDPIQSAVHDYPGIAQIIIQLTLVVSCAFLKFVVPRQRI